MKSSVKRSDYSRGLVEAQTVTEFLRAWIDDHMTGESLTDLSIRCGVGSRGFLHDLLKGRRRLTLESFEKVCRGLGIQGAAKKHFRLLQTLQGAQGENRPKFLRLLETNRRKMKGIADARTFSGLPKVRGWDRIYAACGTVEEGATLAEIRSRSRMTLPRTKEVLHHLREIGLVTVDEEKKRIFPRVLHASFGFGPAAAELGHYLLSALDDVQGECARRFKKGTHQQNLYRNLVFSLESKRYEEFRDRLRQLLEEFVDSAEKPDGDRVARVFCSFELLS